MQYIVGTGAFSKAGKSCRLLTAFHKTGSAGNLMIGSYELGKTADKYISGDASFTWEEIKGDLFKVAMTGTSMWGSAKDFGTSYCFVAGTLVTTEDGQEPIEEIEVGDKVLSEDETTGEVAVKTVTETYVNETDELIHIGVNGETISATPTHPFYVDKLGWTLARSLRAGDVLVLSNGELVTVEWVQHEILESPIKVYNFEVEDFHTYFVGECGVLVHNECTVPELSDNWKDNITSDSGVRDGTDIPRSFELKGYEVNGNKVKVHPNATKHMSERVNAANGSILVENEMMISFEESVASVLPNVKDSRNFFENVNGWELGIDGSDGTVYHALLK